MISVSAFTLWVLFWFIRAEISSFLTSRRDLILLDSVYNTSNSWSWRDFMACLWDSERESSLFFYSSRTWESWSSSCWTLDLSFSLSSLILEFSTSFWFLVLFNFKVISWISFSLSSMMSFIFLSCSSYKEAFLAWVYLMKSILSLPIYNNNIINIFLFRRK